MTGLKEEAAAAQSDPHGTSRRVTKLQSLVEAAAARLPATSPPVGRRCYNTARRSVTGWAWTGTGAAGGHTNAGSLTGDGENVVVDTATSMDYLA